MKTLRPYQTAALDATLAQLKQYDSAVVVLPTGLGKTVYATKLMAGWDRGNCLFLAHTRELIAQAADKLAAELGYRPAVEMNVQGIDPDTLWQGGLVVVGSVQTMYGDRRLAKYERHPFGLIVVDECFPAGTLIDGRPIESVRIGDMVTAFDPVSGATVRRAVEWVFTSPAPPTLYTIHAGSRSVTATGNHPFFTERGWVHASDIQVGDDVYGLFPAVHSPAGAAADEVAGRGETPVLLPPVLLTGQVPDSPVCLRDVRHDVLAAQPLGEVKAEEVVTGLLLAGLREGGNGGQVCGDDGGDEPQARPGEDEGAEPDEAGRGAGEAVGDAQGHATRPNGSSRERSRDDGGRAGAVGRDRADPVRPASRTGGRLPDSLQAGFGGPGGEAGCGGGRAEPLCPEGEGGGRTEGRLLDVSRVVRVEVHERGGAGRYSEVCPNGLVYNLEVDRDHTYLANGFAVHNCHHSTSSTYRKVIDHFRRINPNLKVVGITATPNRADGTALGLMFDAVAYQMSINDAIGDGWLVPVAQEYVVVDTLELDGLKLGKNEFGEADFKAADLEACLTEEEALHKQAIPTVRKVGDRRTLVFTSTVRHAHDLAAVLNRYKPESAAAVDGTTLPERRKELIRDFSEGRLQFLCNCAVLTEGFDAPVCSAVVMARPTKSLSLYTQMLGRGLRPLPGVVDGVPDGTDRRLGILTSDKPNCLVIDFVGNSEHKLASSYDVLGGNYDAETRALARQEARRQARDVNAVMDQASKLLALERQMKEREHVKAAGAGFVAYDVDPFGDGPGVVGSGYVGPKRGTATDSQVRFLVNLGVQKAVAESYSKRQAGAVIDSLSATRCTVKQAATLAKHGVPADGVGVARASRIIDAIAANGWRRPQELPE